MFDTLLETYEASTLLAAAGFILGLLMGAVFQRSRFCIRRGIIESSLTQFSPMAGMYAVALMTALIGAVLLERMELVDFSTTLYRAPSFSLFGAIAGGIIFGIGMVATRGCPSRLLTLVGEGNMRSLITLIVLGMVGYATIRGLFAAARTSAVSVLSIDGGAIAEPYYWLVLVGLVVIGLFIVFRSRPSVGQSVGAMLIGAGVVVAWWLSGGLLYDEFDPQPAQSITMIRPVGDTLIYAMTSTGSTLTFGVTLVVGILLGSLLSALLAREFVPVTFTSPAETGRFIFGAALMGFGGTLAGGCTFGAGLTGLSTMSFFPILAVFGMIIGGRVGLRVYGPPLTPGV